MGYLTNNPRRELAIQLRLTAAYERSMSATMRTELNRVLREVADAIEAGGQIGIPLASHRERTSQIFRATYNAVMPDFGDRILNAAGKSRALLRYMRRKDARGEFERRIQTYLAAAGARAVVAATTTQDQIRAVIVAAEAAGLSQRELAARIRRGVPDLPGTGFWSPQVRSQIIARTEVHTASTVASEEAAKATGVVEAKEWVAAEDARTREDHSEADGQVVNIDSSFDVGGTKLAFPGEPAGPPEQVINCRCVVAYITAD